MGRITQSERVSQGDYLPAFFFFFQIVANGPSHPEIFQRSTFSILEVQRAEEHRPVKWAFAVAMVLFVSRVLGFDGPELERTILSDGTPALVEL